MNAGPDDGAAPSTSVLMSVHNAGRYLGEAVESILGQTFADFEFLIVDDGSSDGSGELLQRYAAKDPRIRLERRANEGLVSALNAMALRSRGEFLARMDADDVAMPHRLERQVEFLRANPDHVMVGSRVTLIDPDGCPMVVMPVPLEHEELDAALISGRGQMVYHPAVVFRREALLRAGLYRPEYRYAQDLDIFLKMAEVGRIANLAEPLLKYREHLAKIGHVRAEQQAAIVRAILESARRRRGLADPPEEDTQSPRPSRHGDLRRAWGWLALGGGNLATARKHARACLFREPLNPDTWRLFYCAMRGH